MKLAGTIGRAVLAAALALVTMHSAAEAVGNVVISQIYGGGGVGPYYTHDFIELYNRGTTTVDMSGWRVAYAGAVSSSWASTVFPSGSTIAPGQFFMVRQQSGGSNGVALPGFDAAGTTNLSEFNGKVALLSSTVTGVCPTGTLIDFVAYGTTPNCWEGSGPTGTTLSAQMSAIRGYGDGCIDSDNNAADFGTSQPPLPRYSGSSGYAACKPTVQASNVTFTPVTGTSMTLNWTPGNGSGQILVARAGSAVTASPTSDNLPSSTVFGSGHQLSPGQYVMATGVRPVTITNLSPGTTYHFAVFEYNGTFPRANVLQTSPAIGNRIAAAPTYTWTAATTDFQVATNWTPSRTGPVTTDVLKFASAGPFTVTNVPNQTVAQVTLSANAAVNLQSTAGTTLTITGDAGTDLDIPAGCILTTSGSNALRLTMGNSTAAAIGGTLAVGATMSTNGTTQVDGSFQINPGGSATGASFTYNNSTGTLVFNHSSGSYGVNNDAYWPAANGPAKVTVFAGGGITMNVARTVSTNFQTAASVVNGNNLTLNGTCQLNSGGSFTGSPTFGAASILRYATGGPLSAGAEWTGSGAGAGGARAAGSGQPQHVIIDSGALTLSGVPRALPGNLNWNGGGLALTAGGDLAIGGNWSRTSGTTFTHNGVPVWFIGSGLQSIFLSGGPETFSRLLVRNSGAGVQMAGSVTATGASGDALQLLTGDLDVNAAVLTLSGGGNLRVDGGPRTIKGTANAQLRFSANTLINPTGGGTLSIFPANLPTTVLAAGVNFNNVTTINGLVQLDAGGFVDTNPPTYGSATTLQYNNPAGFNVGAEWNSAATTAGLGVPRNVKVTTGAVTFPSGADRTVPGNLDLTGATAGIVLQGGDLTCRLQTQLYNQKITTNAGAFIVPTGGTLLRGNGYVVGNLQKAVASGSAVTRTFEVGDAGNYTPCEVQFSTVSAAGNLTASTAVPSGPPTAGTPPAGSGISQSRYVKRVWTLANDGVGFTDYKAKMTFVNGDKQNGADFSTFIVAKSDGATWSNPAVSARTSLSTEASGLTTFSDFHVGESGCGAITLSPAAGALPGASTISPYSETITASPAGSYTFAVTGGTLPGELSLSGGGAITGTANAPGTFNFTVTATDAGSCTGSAAYSIVVSAPATHPELVVEQPAGTDVSEGGSRDFGIVTVGSSADLVFTIRNSGDADLTGLGITVDGDDAAMFSVTASPTAPVSGPGGSTTFTVHFAPTSAGVKVAALHIASNDADENPFDIELNGSGDLPVATTIALVGTEATPERVKLHWHASSYDLRATLQRCGENQEWFHVAQVWSDGTGSIRYEDANVVAGDRYGYRLEISDGGSTVHLGETWVDVPKPLMLAIDGFRPNPAMGSPTVSFTLPAAGPTRLELLDMMGRRVAITEWTTLEGGAHTARWPGARISPGVYVTRLTFVGRTLSARGVILRP